MMQMALSSISKPNEFTSFDCSSHVLSGNTPTKMYKLNFPDVIRAINQYAFETSQYPLILSLEIHCKAAGQLEMARIMKGILKDTLLTEANSPKLADILPSPELLKNRIILKVSSKYTQSALANHLDRGSEPKRSLLLAKRLCRIFKICS